MSQLQDVAFWSEEYVASLQISEPAWLDCKQSGWFTLDEGCMNHLSKYASAFANYDGGYLIIGVKDPTNNQPFEIDGGVSLALKPKLKDWLEVQIPNLVDTRLEKINIRIIEANGASSQIKSGHCLIVIHIPESLAAPHQARDHKYYNRVGSNNDPLRHRAVLDIFSRRTHPDIKLTLRINVDRVQGKNAIHWHLQNIGRVAARQFHLVLNVPYNIENNAMRVDSPDAKLWRNSSEEPIFWRLTVSNHQDRPLFPGGVVIKRVLIA